MGLAPHLRAAVTNALSGASKGQTNPYKETAELTVTTAHTNASNRIGAGPQLPVKQ